MTIAEETSVTRSASDAIGTEADIKDAASLDGGFYRASNSSSAPKRILTSPIWGGPDIKRVLQRLPTFPFFVPLCIRLEFKHLQRVLAISYSLLLMCFCFTVGDLRSTQVIFKILHRLFKCISFGPQSSSCPFRTLTHLLKGLLSS